MGAANNNDLCQFQHIPVFCTTGTADRCVRCVLGEFQGQISSRIERKLTIAQALRRSFYGPLHTLDGPWYTRFTNLVLKYKTLMGQRVFYIHELHKRYGPVVRVEPYEVDVCDLDAFREVHRIGSGFVKSEWYDLSTPGIEDNVFAMTKIQDHAARRRLLARPFSRSSLLANFQNLVTERARLAVSKIKEEASQGDCDAMKWWTLMSTDVIAQVAFGDDSRLLEAGRVSHHAAQAPRRSSCSSIYRP